MQTLLLLDICIYGLGKIWYIINLVMDKVIQFYIAYTNLLNTVKETDGMQREIEEIICAQKTIKHV